jgi:hypothetical protein
MRITDISNRKLAVLLEDNGIEREPFDVFIEDVAGPGYEYGGTDPDVIVTAFNDAFAGAGSLEDYAYDFASECLGLDGTALSYFDYAKYARDLDWSGEMLEARGYRFYTTW